MRLKETANPNENSKIYQNKSRGRGNAEEKGAEKKCRKKWRIGKNYDSFYWGRKQQ